MKKYLATFENGYCHCGTEEIIEADSLEEAENIACDMIDDYAAGYEYVLHLDDIEDEEEREEERTAYYENCIVCVEECTDED